MKVTISADSLVLICFFAGDVPQVDQEQETEEELLSVALKDTADQQMFVPFDPFAPLGDDNKLTTIEELAKNMDKSTKQVRTLTLRIRCNLPW